MCAIWDLVPQSLNTDDLAHLFGVQEFDLSDPSNSLSLHLKVEELLNEGVIAIIPAAEDTTPTSWRCICLDDSKKKVMVLVIGDKPIEMVLQVGDLENIELKFLNDNRPRDRFLYFRFLISYFRAKAQNLPGTEKLDGMDIWSLGKPWLERSVINEVARCVSGSHLPLMLDNCFEGPVTAAEEAETSGLRISSQLLEDNFIASGALLESESDSQELRL